MMHHSLPPCFIVCTFACEAVLIACAAVFDCVPQLQFSTACHGVSHTQVYTANILAGFMKEPVVTAH